MGCLVNCFYILIHTLFSVPFLSIVVVPFQPNFFLFILLGVNKCIYNMYIYRKSQNFVVKIFSDSMGSAKIKRMNIMCIINTNAVRKLFNTKINHMKYF